MSEVTFIRLTKNGDFDGTTVITSTRDQLVEANRRLFTGAIADSVEAGLIGGSGSFSAESPKLVGVAFSGNDPHTTVRVLDAANRVRQEVSLRTDFQYVVVHAQDKIVAGEVPVELMLAVDEMNEHDMVSWAAAHPPRDIHAHFRIIRRGAFCSRCRRRYMATGVGLESGESTLGGRE